MKMSSNFTFHYGIIKIRITNTRDFQQTTFTFHYGIIKIKVFSDDTDS